jgi:hypothetical protein
MDQKGIFRIYELQVIILDTIQLNLWYIDNVNSSFGVIAGVCVALALCQSLCVFNCVCVCVCVCLYVCFSTITVKDLLKSWAKLEGTNSTDSLLKASFIQNSYQ